MPDSQQRITACRRICGPALQQHRLADRMQRAADHRQPAPDSHARGHVVLESYHDKE